MTQGFVRIAIVYLLALAFTACGQKEEFYDLRENANYNKIQLDPKSLQVRDYQSGKWVLDYVHPILCTWKWYKNKPDTVFSGVFLQALSHVGDVKAVNQISSLELPPYPQLSDTAYINKHKRKKLSHHQAKEFLIKSFREHNIIMFNEAHDRPQTRAFLLSILKDLRNAGAECLAMEMLSHDGKLDELDESTGHFASEPVAGEIIREALRLGLKLIPYEENDRKNAQLQTLIPDQMRRREFAQAQNLYNGIKSGNKIRKTVVLAGYGHIAERYDSTFTSMAMNFEKLCGIDPLTVEQTLLLEDFKDSPYANKLLAATLPKDTIVAFTTGTLKHFGFDSTMYDISIYHPKTRYIHNRPAWLLTSERKHFVGFEIPKSVKPVLVQAYLWDEIRSEKDYATRVPEDQTFYAENNKAWLVLTKGRKYYIVFRNDKNEIIHRLDTPGIPGN